MGNVVISPNIRKQSDRIDPSGNIVNARTKEIIQPVEPAYVPPVQETVEIPYKAPQAPTTNAISIQQQIDEAKENLLKLQELKKLKIAEMKAQLELLETE